MMLIVNVVAFLQLISATVGIEGFVPFEQCRNPRPIAVQIEPSEKGVKVLTVIECEGDTHKTIEPFKLRAIKQGS